MRTTSQKPNEHCHSCEQTVKWTFDEEIGVWFHRCLRPISKKQARHLEKLMNPQLKESAHAMDDEEEDLHESCPSEELTEMAIRLDAYVVGIGRPIGTVKLVLHRDADGIEVEACQLVGDRGVWSRFYDAYQGGTLDL